MPNQTHYPPNSNPIAPSWRLAQYTFPEVAPGYCLQKATYFSNFTLAPLGNVFNQEMPIDRFSDFIWNELRFALINVDAALYPNVLIRVRDSRGRRMISDFSNIQHIAGMLPLPMTFLAGTSAYIDAQADDSQVNTIQFSVIAKGWKRFRA